MRNVIAGLVALALLFYALRMLTTLRFHQRRRQQAREAEHTLGRAIVVEIPAGEDLVAFSEDARCFYYGRRSIEKRLIRAVRLLVNGSPLATAVSGHSQRHGDAGATSASIDDRPEGIARDRWDVAIDVGSETVLIECGAIRERVSQELAGKVFGAVKSAIETRS